MVVNMDKPIFIHSLFRTGSTYIWNKFRELDTFTCYYEPLHNELIGIRKVTEDTDTYKFKYNKHPQLDKDYFWEFNPFIEDDGGVINFKEKFVADDFCYNGNNPDMRAYIDMLIGDASCRPVLQFNRSALRTKWFKHNYKDSVSIYLVRDPKDNFMSFERYLSDGNPFFSAMDLVFISYNIDQPVFYWLCKYMDIEPMNEGIEDAISICSDKILNYSLVHRYMMFYTIWYSALLFNSVYADIIIDINKLTDSITYNNSVTESLSNLGVFGITFEDANMNRHTDYLLSEDAMSLVEDIVQTNIKSVINYG